MKKGYIKMSEENIKITGLTKPELMKVITISITNLIQDNVISKENFEHMSKLILADPEELMDILKEQLKELQDLLGGENNEIQ